MSHPASTSTQPSVDLLEAFRSRYNRFARAIHDAVGNQTDSVVLARLGDDLDEFLGLINEVS